MTSAVYLLVLALAAGTPAVEASLQADEAASTQATSGARIDPAALPVDLDKIQRRLSRDPAIVVTTPGESDDGMPTFRVRIDARKLTIHEILGPDYLRGPVPAGAMTHQEFLNMVTPREVQGFSAFTNAQGATVALTALALQWALKTALEQFHNARDARAKEAARKEVATALEALRQARLDAGLPPK